MIKIKLECWWTNSHSLNTRMIKQFITNDDLNRYSFVTENPDFTVVFGRTEWNKIETPKEKTIYFSQEPLWSPNEPKDNIHDFCSKIFVSDKREYPNRPEYIETLLPMFYGGRGEVDHRVEWDWSSDIRNKTYIKSKNTSIIVRKDASEHYYHLANEMTSKVNYALRTNLSIELSNNKLIDVYGTFWEKNNENIKGEIWNKHVGLDEYQFSLACENSIQKNYISEKFWDVILTETVPIYLGCNNINELIPVDSFIYLNDKTTSDMVEIVNDIVNNNEYYYNKHKDYILNLKNDFFKNPKYNLWERIKKEINEL